LTLVERRGGAFPKARQYVEFRWLSGDRFGLAGAGYCRRREWFGKFQFMDFAQQVDSHFHSVFNKLFVDFGGVTGRGVL